MKTFFRILAAMVVISMTSLHAAEPRPNVLFIAVDDLRTSLGCYGDTLVKSPNIDRFAATARRFDHAYTQQAVCGPSRTSLLTGRLPDNTRVWHNRNLFRDTQPDIITLPQLFKNHGYRAVSLGKIFSGNERELDPDSWTEPEILKPKGWKNSAIDDTSSEGKALENPADEAPDYVYQRTVNPEDAPDSPEYIEITFEKGDAVAINGKTLSPATILTDLNEYGRKHGIGRLDFVENRFVGMKSRGIYETPGGTILLEAHRGIEQITLDAGAGHLKDSLMPRYAELIYNGFWFSPEREMLQALIDKSQEDVEGEVRLTLYKGNVIVAGRKSAKSLYSDALVTFEDDRGAYDQKDAAGFIRLNALRLRTLAARRRQGGS